MYYGDIKPPNFLVTFEGVNAKILKIGDFGTAVEIKAKEEGKTTLTGYSEDYSMPEIVECIEKGIIEFEKEKLIENEIHCFWKTFKETLNLIEDIECTIEIPNKKVDIKKLNLYVNYFKNYCK